MLYAARVPAAGNVKMAEVDATAAAAVPAAAENGVLLEFGVMMMLVKDKPRRAGLPAIAAVVVRAGGRLGSPACMPGP